MTKSFGDPNRQPRKPGRSYRTGSQLPPQAQPQPQPQISQSDEPEFHFNLPNWSPSDRAYPDHVQPGREAPLALVKPDSSRRTVAIFIDLFACYVLGLIVSLVPFLSRLVPLPFVFALGYLTRDFLFAGRGIGKNFMGFQVVDRRNGMPVNLSQSFMRNIILVVPFVVVGVASSLLNLYPLGLLGTFLLRIVNFLGSVYVLIVFPMEAYRVFMTETGLRKGDEIAGTMLVDAPMDFSQILPKQ